MRIRIARLLASFCLAFPALQAIGQTTVWSENFNNGCSVGCFAAGYNGWTVQNNSGGTSGGSPNDWFISCAEEGVVPPGCGSTCVGDASLHIGADAGGGGDMGATFNETGLTNATFKQATSPTINMTGYTNLTLNFDFIAFGSSACSDDRAQLRLSTDNGATWPVGFQYCLTSVCCGSCNGYSQGQWTTYTLALPAAFNNNPNIRVGFHWRNNGNGSGTDPSVAIDDVRITTVVFPVKLTSFQVREDAGHSRLSWTVTEETRMDRYEVERSAEPRGFKSIGSVAARGGQGEYHFRDPGALGEAQYYRLKMVDRDGSSTYSNIVRLVPGATEALAMTAFAQSAYHNTVDLELWAMLEMEALVEVHDMQGRLVLNMPSQKLLAGRNNLQLDLSERAAGAYLVTVKSVGAPKGYSPVRISRKFVLAH